MLDSFPHTNISDIAKCNSKLAKGIDKEVTGKHEFFYWLGYFDGQKSMQKESHLGSSVKI